MKYLKLGALFVAGIFAIPLFLGIIDLMWYFYTNHILTTINWDANRVMFAMSSPIPALIVGILISDN